MVQGNQEWHVPSVGLLKFLLLRLSIRAINQNQHKTHICVDWGISCSVGSVRKWLSNASGDQSDFVNALVNHLDMVEQCAWCRWKHNPFLFENFPHHYLNQTEVSDMRMCPRDRWMLSYVGNLGRYWFDIVGKSIHERKHFTSSTIVNNLVDKGSRIVVFWTSKIYIPIIDANSDGSLFFHNRNDVGNPLS